MLKTVCFVVLLFSCLDILLYSWLSVRLNNQTTKPLNNHFFEPSSVKKRSKRSRSPTLPQLKLLRIIAS